MKKTLKSITVTITIISILLSLTYILLLMMSGFADIDMIVEDNFLFKDWFFMTIPILGFLTGILLQVVSLRKKKRKA